MNATKTIRNSINGTFDYRGLAALNHPIAWQGTVSAEERARQEADLAALLSDAREAIDASGGHSVEIKNGEIVATIHD
jgi:hypothetical protein